MRRTLCLLGSLRAARPARAAAATATRPPEPRELRRREVLGGLVSSRDAALPGASKPPATRLCPREVLKSRHSPRQPRGLELSPILKRPAVLIGFREGATVGGHTRCTGPAGSRAGDGRGRAASARPTAAGGTGPRAWRPTEREKQTRTHTEDSWREGQSLLGSFVPGFIPKLHLTLPPSEQVTQNGGSDTPPPHPAGTLSPPLRAVGCKHF